MVTDAFRLYALIHKSLINKHHEKNGFTRVSRQLCPIQSAGSLCESSLLGPVQDAVPHSMNIDYYYSTKIIMTT